MNPVSLNIHLPFSYWLATDPVTGAPLTKPSPRGIALYMRALERELESLGEDLREHEIDSVYFAGGYMSLLDSDEFAALMAAVHRSFRLTKDVQIAGTVFPGSLDMALVSQYHNYGVGPLMFEIPSLLARECERLRLPNALQAMDHTVYLLQSFRTGGFGLRLPIGLPGRDEGIWKHIFGQINHYQPMHVAFFDVSGGAATEHPAFEETKEALRALGLREVAPLLFTAAKETPRLALAREFAGVGLGAPSRLDGFFTKNTGDMGVYLARSGNYRDLLVSVEDLEEG